jgi:hemoglobin
MSRRVTATVAVLSGVMALGLAGCQDGGMFGKKSTSASSSKTSAMKTDAKSLYARLGGEQAISKVVDDFVAIAAADPAVNFTRKGHPAEWQATPENIRHLKEKLVEFIGSATGGPQQYTGKSMPVSHTGMEITDAEFNAAAADLKQALAKNKVPEPLQQELLAIVGTTRSQMVGK